MLGLSIWPSWNQSLNLHDHVPAKLMKRRQSTSHFEGLDQPEPNKSNRNRPIASILNISQLQINFTSNCDLKITYYHHPKKDKYNRHENNDCLADIMNQIKLKLNWSINDAMTIADYGLFVILIEMGNCCYDIAPPITSLQEHQDNNYPPLPIQVALQPPIQPVTSSNSAEQMIAQVHQKQIKNIQVVQEIQPKQERNEAYEHLIQLYRRIYHFYANHDVDSCMPLIKQLKQIQAQQCSKKGIDHEALQKQIELYISVNFQHMKEKLESVDLKQNINISQIEKEHHDILHYEQEISGGIWQQSYNKKGIKLSTRRQDTSVGVLIETDLELPFQVLIAILTEIDLYPEFIPFNQISKKQKQFSRNCRIGYNLNNYPFLSKREVYFQGIGYSRLRTKDEVFLFTRSIQDKKNLQDYLEFPVKMNEDYVQLIYKYFVVKYRPIKKGLGKLIMALNADMGLNFLPNFILEYLAKDFAKQFVSCILQIGKDFKGSKWQQSVKKNPALYDFFKKEIDDYLHRRQMMMVD